MNSTVHAEDVAEAGGFNGNAPLSERGGTMEPVAAIRPSPMDLLFAAHRAVVADKIRIGQRLIAAEAMMNAGTMAASCRALCVSQAEALECMAIAEAVLEAAENAAERAAEGGAA